VSDPALDLDRRSGWPTELRFLLERYPREVWPTHPNLGKTLRFWLARHDMFRELGGALGQGVGAFRAGQVGAAEFRRWFAPRLRFFLHELEGHHHIEDAHYFPAFLAAERRLARGFDALEGDHDVIHADLLAAAEAGRGFADSLARGEAARAADGYAAEADRLLRRLLAHLRDEEDLIAPLLLDRGEAAILRQGGIG
jgi:hypothetical protein